MKYNPFVKMSIGERLAFLRSQSGKSLRDVSKESGVAYGYLNELERGKYSNPGIDRLLTLSKTFGITVSEFLRGL
jgi:transcriptional regulator with XRE-family HTH domain